MRILSGAIVSAAELQSTVFGQGRSGLPSRDLCKQLWNHTTRTQDQTAEAAVDARTDKPTLFFCDGHRKAVAKVWKIVTFLPF